MKLLLLLTFCRRYHWKLSSPVLHGPQHIKSLLFIELNRKYAYIQRLNLPRHNAIIVVVFNLHTHTHTHSIFVEYIFFCNNINAHFIAFCNFAFAISLAGVYRSFQLHRSSFQLLNIVWQNLMQFVMDLSNIDVCWISCWCLWFACEELHTQKNHTVPTGWHMCYLNFAFR